MIVFERGHFGEVVDIRNSSAENLQAGGFRYATQGSKIVLIVLAFEESPFVSSTKLLGSI